MAPPSEHSVLEADNGQSGWETFEREHPRLDVVLLDLSMPEVSGQELLERMLALEPATRVVVSSGYSGAPSVGLERCSAVLRKPYQLTELFAALREAVAS